MNEDGTRHFRVTLAEIRFSEIEVVALSGAAAREMARERKSEARSKFSTDGFPTRTERIERLVDGKPVWIDDE